MSSDPGGDLNMLAKHLALSLVLLLVPAMGGAASLRAGAAKVDVTPTHFPVIANCMFLERKAEKAHAPLHAKALVLGDGRTRLAIVVVDSCMMPRELIDRAKDMARAKTGIPAERMLVSATHTHSAPASMGCLGSDAQQEYAESLPGKIAGAIEQAAARLAPAKAGWASIDDYEHTHCRRWIFRPDKMRSDPFGNLNVRANMHPGYQNPDAIAPSGPVDPGLSVLSVQTLGGKPLAVLANYSQHYFGSPILHPDYFGIFSDKLAARIGAGEDFVAMMSQGTSGDQMWMDYGKPKSDITLDQYSDGVTAKALEAYRKIQYRASLKLEMAETRLTLGRRAPDSQRLEWAKSLLAKMDARTPSNQQEVYAREQVFLHDEPSRELKLQAVRIGDLGIAAIPNEVFAITGLRIKAQSPLAGTFVIELANGAEGYIPPPAQHKLGGYTTWPARSAALETGAEPKIAEAILELLEKVSSRKRREPAEMKGPYARAVLASRPSSYWRLSEFAGPQAADATGKHPASYEDGIAFYLEGPESANFSGAQINRAPYFAGGRLVSKVEAGGDYTIEMWFWNGLPPEARAVTGSLFSLGADELSIGGSQETPGRLRFGTASGSVPIPVKTWTYVAFVREGSRVRVFRNGTETPDIDTQATPNVGDKLFVGGHAEGRFNFEGRIDEVAVYPRALAAGEIQRHYRAAVN
ncbi:MAG TPA: LamG-like jellyroll fold domain-containing protein [Bryobacteraceae bacterium]|nr:LamG-like jellyroll fold domain-containing protein [Bryobacteraceae bacterium]